MLLEDERKDGHKHVEKPRVTEGISSQLGRLLGRLLLLLLLREFSIEQSGSRLFKTLLTIERSLV